MKADYFVFDEWDTIERAEVEANKRRAKERVREAKSIESYYWKQVWTIVGITMIWGSVLAIVLAGIVCSIDYVWRLFGL